MKKRVAVSTMNKVFQPFFWGGNMYSLNRFVPALAVCAVMACSAPIFANEASNNVILNETILNNKENLRYAQDDKFGTPTGFAVNTNKFTLNQRGLGGYLALSQGVSTGFAVDTKSPFVEGGIRSCLITLKNFLPALLLI